MYARPQFACCKSATHPRHALKCEMMRVFRRPPTLPTLVALAILLGVVNIALPRQSTSSLPAQTINNNQLCHTCQCGTTGGAAGPKEGYFIEKPDWPSECNVFINTSLTHTLGGVISGPGPNGSPPATYDKCFWNAQVQLSQNVILNWDLNGQNNKQNNMDWHIGMWLNYGQPNPLTTLYKASSVSCASLDGAVFTLLGAPTSLRNGNVACSLPKTLTLRAFVNTVLSQCVAPGPPPPPLNRVCCVAGSESAGTAPTCKVQNQDTEVCSSPNYIYASNFTPGSQAQNDAMAACTSPTSTCGKYFCVNIDGGQEAGTLQQCRRSPLIDTANSCENAGIPLCTSAGNPPTTYINPPFLGSSTLLHGHKYPGTNQSGYAVFGDCQTACNPLGGTSGTTGANTIQCGPDVFGNINTCYPDNGEV